MVWSLLSAPALIQEVQVLAPVVGGDVVFSGANVVGDVVLDRGVDGLIGLGQSGGGEALMAEEGVDAADIDCGEELCVGIGPEVVLGAGDVERARSDEGQEEVAVDGDLGFVSDPLGVVLTEPVREGVLKVCDVLAVATAVDGLASFSGLGGEDDGEAGVLGGGPVGGFAEAGVSGDCDAFGVYLFVSLEIVESSAESPGPGAECSPVVGCGCGLACGVEEGPDAELDGVGKVWIDVTAVDGGKAIAAGEDFLDLPLLGLKAARFFVWRYEVGWFCGLGGAGPSGVEADSGVGEDGLVAEEVEAEDDWCGAVVVGGEV